MCESHSEHMATAHTRGRQTRRRRPPITLLWYRTCKFAGIANQALEEVEHAADALAEHATAHSVAEHVPHDQPAHHRGAYAEHPA